VATVKRILARRCGPAAYLRGLIVGGVLAACVPICCLDALYPDEAIAAETLSAAAWDSLSLARATHLWMQDDLRGAVLHLETIDVREGSAFARADRAAFLLAMAHLRLGDRAAFLKIADTGNPASDSPYRQWLGYARILVSGTAAEGSGAAAKEFWNLPGAAVLTAAHLLESGRPRAAADLLDDHEPVREFELVHHYLNALAASGSGLDSEVAWRKFASRQPANPREQELVAIGWLTLAGKESRRGDDPTATLTRVPGTGPAALQAIQTRTLLALAAGDTASAEKILSVNTPEEVHGPEARRLVQIAGQMATETADWPAALQHLEIAISSWDEETAWLASLADSVQAAQTWSIWTSQMQREGEIPLPDLDWSTALAQLATEAIDLTGEPDFKRPEFGQTTGATAGPAAAHLVYARTHRPDQGQWLGWDRLAARKSQAEAELGHLEQTLADLEAERDLRQDYLASGSLEATRSTVQLELALRDLDGLLARLDLALADLERTRSEALRLFAQRVANLATELRASVLYILAVQQFHIAGPGTDQVDTWPATVPRPADLLIAEQDLIGEIQNFLTLFAELTPELVNRSCEEIWVPRLAADGPTLRLALATQQRRGTRLTTAIDSTALVLPIDREIAGMSAYRDDKATVVDSLTRAETLVREEILGQVAARGQDRLIREREGIDYLRGNVLYWVAVDDASASDDETAGDRARRSRGQARQALQDYLDHYGEGRARTESLYRLADLELLRARDDFQIRMAEFLGEKPATSDLQNKDLAPFVDYAPAIALYREILTTDPDFDHLPAVLFQLGMILGDAGDPESAGHLETLVARYPDSPFNQEAWLRLGDQYFERRDFVACQPCFVATAKGDDPSLQAIALYKLGWARFELDQFASAADAFGELLDHYETGEDPAAGAGGLRTNTDLKDEAEQYLVHSLIRAGGAKAFTEHFHRVGGRTHEAEILIAMGHQLAGVSLYGEAIACDRLWFERFGDRNQALAVAQRLVQSHRRWNKPAEARRIHLALAEHFLPDQAWSMARDDSLIRTEADKFAREAYQNAAVYHHQQARKNDSPNSWRLALQHYDSFLDHWSDDDTAARMHHQAGEAAYRLGLHSVALDHFGVAATHKSAAADTAGFVREAAWQVVAVSDTWYRDSQFGDPAVAGPDSLARQLLAAATAFQDRYPDDEELPALMWRTGQVAYAHRWYREAAGSLSDLGRGYPGDPNALQAFRMSGDAWYHLREYPAAADAYQQTLQLAQQTKADSVAAEMVPIIPHCHFRHADQIAAADSVQGPAAAAPFFEQMATRWPDSENADLALYRAGLGFAAGNDPTAAVAVWEQLLTGYPESLYARDSALQIASAHEKAGQWQAASVALDRFSADFSTDPDAPGALLKASDLQAAGGDSAGSEKLKTMFLQRFSGETETVMAIREERAAHTLDSLAAGQSPDTQPGLQAYLALAAEHPELASPVVLARVDYLKAEQAHTNYTDLVLTQPLPSAIKVKQESLENLLAMYAACARHGVAEYTRAAAFRTGQAITHFGDALLASERPAELQGDDLLAYEEILAEQSWPFFDRGEAAWTDLLKQTDEGPEDPGQWLERTRQELWPRVAQRFMHLPEAEYPLVAAIPPADQDVDETAGRNN
jgi:TolA-binding protein